MAHHRADTDVEKATSPQEYNDEACEASEQAPLCRSNGDKVHTATATTLAVPDFVPSWEGLRGVAVLMTCYSHAGATSASSDDVLGRGGVAIFFVLSGFLITGVLVKQQTSTQRPSERLHYRHLLRFYMDRNVRLYPALVTMVVVTGLLWMQKEAWRVPVDFAKEAARTLLYVENIDFGPKRTNYWGNTWSLAVEEQFYIVWSLLLPVLLTLRPATRRGAVFALFSASFCLYYLGITNTPLFGVNVQGWYAAPSNFWKMYVGALLRLSPTLPRWLLHRVTGYAGMACIAALTVWSMSSASPVDVSYFFGGSEAAVRYGGWRVLHEPLSTASAVLLLLGSMHGNAVLQSDLLRFFGRVSYAWYLYQWPLLLMIDWPHGYVGYAVTAMALVFAAFSTFYIEEPIRARYRRLRHHRRC